MAYYRQSATVPPKRHTQHRDADGTPLLRGADGRGGLLLRLLAALPPRRAVGDRRLPRCGSCPTSTARPTTRSSRGTSSCTTLFADGAGADAVTGRRLVLGNNDVRIGYVVTGVDPSPYYRNAIGDECVYVEAGSGTVETVFGVLSYRTGDYVMSRGRPRTAGSRPSRAGSTRSRPTATSRRRSATCRGTASCSSTRRTASATCTARPSRSSSRATTSRCWSSTAPAPASSAPG